MLLNYNKTNFIQFFPNTSYLALDTIEFNTHKINSVNSITFLGILIDILLTWKEHIEYTNSRLNTRLFGSLPLTGIRIKNCKTNLFLQCSFSVKFWYYVLG
jgi:hypothetical protein